MVIYILVIPTEMAATCRLSLKIIQKLRLVQNIALQGDMGTP